MSHAPSPQMSISACLFMGLVALAASCGDGSSTPARFDSGVVPGDDAGLPDGSPRDSGGPDEVGADLPGDVAPSCGVNATRVDGVCRCDPGTFEDPQGRCVVCLDNSSCDGRVCADGVCRGCTTDAECGASLFCGDDGRCVESLPGCDSEGEQRCHSHGVQICEGGQWVSDASGICAYGCDELTGACYPDTNVGWIGGRCLEPNDCARMDAVAECLTDDEGFVEGMCSQLCTGICPDRDAATDAVTFCVDSEGLTPDGICVSRCDLELFSDTGCRAGYECRPMPRYGAAGVVESVCLPVNWALNPSHRFDFGVASGAITDHSAVVWAQTGSAEAAVVVEFGTDASDLDHRAESHSSPETGYTVQVPLAGLEPEREYSYRFVLDGLVTSPIGHFRTAPAPGAASPVRFMFSGDVDQNRPELLGIFDTMRTFDVDFFLNLGDWPIADSANTLEEYREVHGLGRTDSRPQAFLQRNAVYSMFDDHEVHNDWDAAYRAAHPASVEAGLRAWREWWPFASADPDQYYHRARWGEVELFFLDCRSRRDDHTAPDGPDKSMLGLAQRQWLLDALADSDAVFKIILSSVPLDYGTTGTDSWQGYAYERGLIEDAIVTGGIGGVVFLTADQHWFAAHHHNSGFKEFMSCPLTRVLRNPPSTADPHQVEVLKDYNFSIATYDPSDETLLIEAYDDQGSLFYSERIRSGRGRIEVQSNMPATFTICPSNASIDECTHVFDGEAPATFEYAVPGPYEIHWDPASGLASLPPETGVLVDGGTLVFSAEFGHVDLPFADPFDSDLGWAIVDDGDTDAPSDWVRTTDELGNGVFEQRSNIYMAPPDLDGTGPIDKLGTLAHIGDPTWSDYVVHVRFRASDDDGIGLIARYQDRDNYLRLSLDRQRGFARLVARVDGQFRLLDSETPYVGYAADTWTEISLSVSGDTVEASVDGTLLLSATQGDLPEGAVGLYSWGSEGLQFDDLSVEAR